MTFLSIDANNKLYEAKLNAENNNRNVSEINKTISDNSIFATNSLQYDLSVDNTNSINQNLFIPDDEIVDSFEYQTSDINANARELYDELEQTREDQGIIGKLWDGFKNLTGFGAGSNKAENAIKQYENGEISLEEAKEKLNGYQQGQETCVDVVGDIVSGIVAVGAFALAVPTGGTSLIAGLGLAAAAGAGSKIAVKAGDAIMGGREYSGKDLLYDSATGAVNGLFAPVTNGVGACVTKTVGKKLGLTVVKEGTKEAIEQGAKQGLKSIITQQGVDVIGGTFAKRALATASGMAIDGAIGGSTDNMIRAALDGEDAKGIFEAGVQGLAGGLIMSPVIGGGFKVAGKLGKNLNNKITTKALFKDGMNTTFKQGQTGDCALLSFLSGAMNNRETQDTIKKSITKSIGGDYHIRIGNQTIDIPKSALTDEMLSDTTGIKLFEAAYKKAGGSIDGEFADSVARQFGFNPVHITGDLITDETLDKIAKEQGTILSFGTKIDADGNVSLEGANHYFSIKNVDTNKKILTLSDPYDTSKTIELSYDDAKKFGISIDGGSIKETELPNSIRNAGDEVYKGIDVSEISKSLETRFAEAGISKETLDDILSEFTTGTSTYTIDKLASELKLSGISVDEFFDCISEYLEIFDGDECAELFSGLLKALKISPYVKNCSYLDSFNLEFKDIYAIQECLNGVGDEMYTKLPEILKSIDSDIFEQLGGMQGFVSVVQDMSDSIQNAYIAFGVINPDNLIEFPVRINGEEKILIFPETSKLPPLTGSGKVQPDAETLLKSNMITSEALAIAKETGVDLTGFATNKSRMFAQDASELVSIDYLLSDIVTKAEKNGFSSLTPHETHVLTDYLRNAYRSNDQFKKALDKEIRNSHGLGNIVNEIYRYVQAMNSAAGSALNKAGIDNVTFDDHFFMRMIDRNLMSTVDNSTGEVLDFNSLITFIAQKAKDSKVNNLKFVNLGNAGGVTIIIERGSGKITIKSIM